MAPVCDDVDMDRDAELARRCSQGDPEAFADLYRRYRARLLRVCTRRLGDAHEADDAVQETFARAWRSLPGYDGSWRVYPWLRTIAGNVCTDVVRRRMRVTLSELSDGHGASIDPFEFHGSAMDARDDLAKLRVILGELPERYRETLLLHEVEGLTSRQIAAGHGTSVRAVETVLLRARRILRNEMARTAVLGVPALGPLGRLWRRLLPSRSVGLRGLRGLRPVTGGALASGAAAAAVLSLVLPGLVPDHVPSPPPPAMHHFVDTSATPPVPPAAVAPATSGASGAEPPPAVRPVAGDAGSAWHPAPGVSVGPAEPAARTANQEPWSTSALGVVVGADVNGAAGQAGQDLSGYGDQLLGGSK